MSEVNTVYRGFHAGHILLALMGGAIAGAGVAYLTAPYSGEETRNRVRGMAQDTNTAAHLMPDAIRKASHAARDAFVEALAIAEEEAEPVLAKPRPRAASKVGKSKDAKATGGKSKPG
jgi:gas vesicle protein